MQSRNRFGFAYILSWIRICFESHYSVSFQQKHHVSEKQKFNKRKSLQTWWKDVIKASRKNISWMISLYDEKLLIKFMQISNHISWWCLFWLLLRFTLHNKPKQIAKRGCFESEIDGVSSIIEVIRKAAAAGSEKGSFMNYVITARLRGLESAEEGDRMSVEKSMVWNSYKSISTLTL